MYRYVRSALVLAGALFVAATGAYAQTILDLPEASQRALVMQRIGLTDITIRYHRPLLGGRTGISNGLPAGQVWRAGANENTTIEVSDPVTVEGKALAKGVYGLHMIPGPNEWTVIFSKNSTSWGSFTYDQAEDALRVTVKPQPSEYHDALTYDFDDVKADSTTVTLRWEKLAIPFKVQVDVNSVVDASLKNQLRGGSRWIWESWNEAADYLITNKGDLNEALAAAEHSIQVEERFENLMTKSRALDALNRKDEATTARNRAFEVGNAAQIHGYGRQLQAQGQPAEALEVFRRNVKLHPNDWLAHNDAARLACAAGDFDGAVREMKLALASAPDGSKAAIEGLVKRLEAKQDINK
jgi:tetratricopeptide (TPR) repeat protein